MPNGGTLTLSTATVVVDETHAKRNEAARPGSYVCLGVSDSGCGMAEDVQSRLFEPFFTTKDPAVADGLGLASIAGLVKQHGGWVELSSKPSVGTRVTVFFPAAPTEAPQCNLAALPSSESLS
jgi:signal transduction histidine kinase